MRRCRFCQVEAKRLCSFHMRTVLYVFLALVAVPAFAGQVVWKWVDEKGVTHFSDQPVPGATKMELNSAPRPSAEPAPSYTPPPQATRPVGPPYARFVVESPQQDESIINTGGKVSVRLSTTPALSAGHNVTIYLDGARVEDFPPYATAHDLPNVPRGTHTIKAVVADPQGSVLQESPSTTFHVRQESVAKPPVGPTLRNPPKRTSSNGNKMRTAQPTYQALNGGQAQIDPNTNMPVKTQPAPNGPKN
jgi:hypothetical protein